MTCKQWMTRELLWNVDGYHLCGGRYDVRRIVTAICLMLNKG